MSSKTVWTNDDTMQLIAFSEASPEVWDSLYMLYKDREKRSICWRAMGEALNASASEVQRKIHNLRYQVFYCMYCMNEL
jgi:hypothetical protein